MPLKPRVVLWRAMYHTDGHQMLAEGGADVIVIDSSNADEVKQALHGARALWVPYPRAPDRRRAGGGKGPRGRVDLRVRYRQYRDPGGDRTRHIGGQSSGLWAGPGFRAHDHDDARNRQAAGVGRQGGAGRLGLGDALRAQDHRARGKDRRDCRDRLYRLGTGAQAALRLPLPRARLRPLCQPPPRAACRRGNDVRSPCHAAREPDSWRWCRN